MRALNLLFNPNTFAPSLCFSLSSIVNSFPVKLHNKYSLEWYKSEIYGFKDNIKDLRMIEYI